MGRKMIIVVRFHRRVGDSDFHDDNNWVRSVYR